MAQTYPDDCVQAFTNNWWIEDKTGTLVRGRLLWTLVPYPEMKPYRLVPLGRGDDPRQHQRAEFRIETFRVGDPPLGTGTLPVAALPVRQGEALVVQRGKRRPAIVLSIGGLPVPGELRAGSSRWQSARSVLVAPYYGAESDGSRGGWPTEFVNRIRHAEYPQYVWDPLPMSSTGSASILRLDHAFPIGGDPANWQLEPYVLSTEALGILDEWLSWLLTNHLSDDTVLAYLRKELSAL